MSKNKKIPVGVVYSTNQNFEYSFSNEAITETLLPERQKLKIQLDEKVLIYLNNQSYKTVKVGG